MPVHVGGDSECPGPFRCVTCAWRPSRQEEPVHAAERVRPEVTGGQPAVPEEAGQGHGGRLVAV